MATLQEISTDQLVKELRSRGFLTVLCSKSTIKGIVEGLEYESTEEIEDMILEEFENIYTPELGISTGVLEMVAASVIQSLEDSEDYDY